MPHTGFLNPDDYARARDLLARWDFTESGIHKRLELSPADRLNLNDIPLFVWRTSGGTGLDTLIRVFYLGLPAPIGRVRAAIHPMRIEEWERAGLLSSNPETAVAQLRLQHYANRWFASDWGGLRREYREDQVMMISGSSVTLANCTIRRPVNTALDLGTGGGVHAILAAEHSRQVTATDINPRAIDIARFNVRLNGISNIELMTGDRFQPVEGRKFNLLICNPPFVISPDRTFLFQDSGMTGDEFIRSLVREVPEFLDEGGFCQMLCQWANRKGEDWKERIQSWFSETGCDVLLLHSTAEDVASYAADWIRNSHQSETIETASGIFQNWMNYYESLGIESIGFGSLVMRRSSRPRNWFAMEDAPKIMVGPVGDSLALGFELHDFLQAARHDSDILGARYSTNPHARILESYKPEGDTWKPDKTELKLDRGLTFSGSVDPVVAGMVMHCRSDCPLLDSINRFAMDIGISADSLQPVLIRITRDLVAKGFLIPEGIGMPEQHCPPHVF